MIVDSSDHDLGEKTRLQLPTMKENDTHCIDFSYLLYSKNGANPGTLNILVRVNKGPLANPIWNVTGFTGKDWLRAELAVSTFWPNEYQVNLQIILISIQGRLLYLICIVASQRPDMLNGGGGFGFVFSYFCFMNFLNI